MRYIAGGFPWGREKSEQDFVGSLHHWEEHSFGKRALIEKKSGEWVGFVELCHVGPGTAGISEDEVEIGWWVTPSAWGRGFATEAAAALLEEGFERLGLDRIVARVQPANVSSVRVAQKIGMRLARETTGGNGEPVLIYVLRQREWRHAPFERNDRERRG